MFSEPLGQDSQTRKVNLEKQFETAEIITLDFKRICNFLLVFIPKIVNKCVKIVSLIELQAVAIINILELISCLCLAFFLLIIQ